MKIAYQGPGGLCIIHSTGVIPVQEVARKDVPAGVPYIFVEDSDIPTDRSTREAWEADFSNPDGYGIGAEAWFLEQEQKALQEALEQSQVDLEQQGITEGTPTEENPAEAVLEPSDINPEGELP